MEEAMRRLHSQGVVPTKQAFGTKSQAGSQHSDAMKAFQAEGKEVQTGERALAVQGAAPRAPRMRARMLVTTAALGPAGLHSQQ